MGYFVLDLLSRFYVFSLTSNETMKHFLSAWVTAFVVITVQNTSGYPVQTLSFNTDQLLDLTYPFNNETIYWVELDKRGWSFNLTTIEDGTKKHGFYFRMNRFHAAEHGGTHLDVPLHHSRNGSDAADIPLKNLMGAAAVINVAEKAAKNLNYAVQLQDITNYEAKYGKILKGAFVFMFTDWGKRWPNKEKFFNTKDIYNTSSLQFPSFGVEAVEFLISKRYIKGIGVDTASVDTARHQTAMPVHRALARAGLVGAELVANLDRLSPVGAMVMLFPMKITEGTGAPLRIIGVLPQTVAKQE